MNRATDDTGPLLSNDREYDLLRKSHSFTVPVHYVYVYMYMRVEDNCIVQFVSVNSVQEVADDATLEIHHGDHGERHQRTHAKLVRYRTTSPDCIPKRNI